MSALKSRLTGLMASAAILLLVVGVPVLLAVIGGVPDLATFSLDSLTAPDDGSLAIAIVTVVGWLAWLVFVTSVAVELFSRGRGIRTPTLRGFSVPQSAARHLVGMAALLFVAAPLTPQPFATSSASAASVAVESPSPAPASPTPKQQPTADSPSSRDQAEPPTRPYTVRRGDSLWKIADAHLGDGRRYTEIVAMNEIVLGGQPDFILPGTTLQIPDERNLATEGVRIVEPGETLASIAQDEYGDPNAWPRIFNASVGTTQPEGAHLSDPDLIRPGWRLTIPQMATSPATPVENPEDPRQKPRAQPEPEPTRRATPDAEGPTPMQIDDANSGSADHGDQESATPAWLLPGLAGAGGLLAGSLFLVLRAGRRTQRRYRRPGFVLESPPEELHPAEKSIHHVGSDSAQRLDVLDRALRGLTSALDDPPRVVSVEVTNKDVRLKGPSGPAPAPWRAEGDMWTAPIDADFATGSDEPAYPLLVSLGEAAGVHHLVNLEELGTVSLLGDEAARLALARHLGTELTLNPWSARVEVATLGLGHELSELDPLRLHQRDAGDLSVVEQFTGDVEGDDPSVAPDPFRVLIAAPAESDESGIQRAAKAVATVEGRSGAAVLAAMAELPEAVVMTLTKDRRLRCDSLGLDIKAAGLTAHEAEVCAAIVDLTRDEPNVVPADPSTTSTQVGLADQTGALLSEHCEERGQEAPGAASLLPRSTESYTGSASTTAEDVARLAPVARATTEERIIEQDPELDSDLAAWQDPTTARPRLALLGPVGARTSGDFKAIRQRTAFYVELLSYLALHPHGVTGPQVAEAFNLTPERARVDLGALRHWLGDNAAGEKFLPSARRRQAQGEPAGAIYRVDELLVDWDLFTRLRARGQARGEAGMDDLITALRLVTGEPFTALRPAGWDWLLDGDRTDHIATCAVIDVAHLVTTHALAEKEFGLARMSSEVGYHAAPDDEIARLDMVAVAAATGHSDLAERQLIDDVLGRGDDDLGPVDVPERTHEIVTAYGWTTRQTSFPERTPNG